MIKILLAKWNAGPLGEDAIKRPYQRAERGRCAPPAARPGMQNRGITLVELLIVITIIGILAVALGFSFQGWLGKYRIESQIKEMYVDLMNARSRAMQRNRAHFVALTTTSYTVYDDTNTSPNGNGTLETASDTQVLAKTLASGSPVTWIGSSQLDFNTRGLALAGYCSSTNATRCSEDNDCPTGETCVPKTICSNTDADADYNCIVISALRINIGQLTTKITDSGVCNATNCVVK